MTSHDHLQHGDKLLVESYLTYVYFFRHGPVPHIRRARCGHFHRQPRTKQYLTAATTEDEIPLRITPSSIPTNYDDLPRQRQRSWKKYRKTQYKPKN